MPRPRELSADSPAWVQRSSHLLGDLLGRPGITLDDLVDLLGLLSSAEVDDLPVPRIEPYRWGGVRAVWVTPNQAVLAVSAGGRLDSARLVYESGQWEIRRAASGPPHPIALFRIDLEWLYPREAGGHSPKTLIRETEF